MIKRTIIFILLFTAITSCRNNNGTNQAVGKPDGNKIIEMNKYLITKDRELITSYCERKDIKAVESPTGLWYSVIKSGNGAQVRDGDLITFEYECSLLDGTLCYSSEGSGHMTTRVGYSTIESGLLEGLKMMNHGAEYIFILPPYLAHGVPGDGDRIPGRSVIVYRIKILPGNR